MIGILVKAINSINRFVKILCMGILFFMMLLGTADVIGRYLFNRPILGTFEIFEILLPAIVLLGLGYTQGNRAHVRMEIFISRLPIRTQTILDLITYCCALFISILILWRGFVLTINYWRIGRTIPTVEIPMYLPQLLVPLGALLLSLTLIVQMIQSLIRLMKRI